MLPAPPVAAEDSEAASGNQRETTPSVPQPEATPVNSVGLATPAVEEIEGAGDCLIVDAPASKKSRLQGWRDSQIGNTRVLVNESGVRFRCPIKGCSFENDVHRSVTVHIARHRASLNGEMINPESQDVLQPATAHGGLKEEAL